MQDLSRSFESRLTALYGKRPQVIKPGLARVEAALACLEPELLRTPTVLVSGTNGKGSTAGFLWEMLSRAGVRAGLYSSPHLWHFAERIQVNGLAIDDAFLLSALDRLEKDLPAAVFDALSFFEVTTLLALRVFHAAQVDFMVLEVGMGGRFDATNVAHPVLSVITSIALDHQQFLGTTTAAIAGEKAGIMRSGCPVLWGGRQAGDAASDAVIRAAASSLGAVLFSEGEDFGMGDGILHATFPGTSPWVSNALPRDIASAPPFLKSNFAKAAAAFKLLEKDGWVRSSLDQILADWDRHKVRMAPSRYGRFHRVEGAPPGCEPRSVILDVGHNPAGAQALVAGLDACGLLARGPLPGLVSILGDKDVNGVLDILRPVLSPLFLFASSSERALTRASLAPRHADLPFFENVSSAWQALEKASDLQAPWVLTGSVYAIGEVFAVLSIDPLSDT